MSLNFYQKNMEKELAMKFYKFAPFTLKGRSTSKSSSESHRMEAKFRRSTFESLYDTLLWVQMFKALYVRCGRHSGLTRCNHVLLKSSTYLLFGFQNIDDAISNLNSYFGPKSYQATENQL